LKKYWQSLNKMKIIVSHISPDIDSIASVWLIKKFYPGWSRAELKFVPAGSTYENKPVDENPEIIHVDTGMGKFDHHQTNDETICATVLVFEFLKKNHFLKKNQIEPLSRMVNQINVFDHFGEVYFPEANSDYFDFLLSNIIDSGLKSTLKNDEEIVNAVFPFLESIFNIFTKKVSAEKEIKKGYVFQSHWGKTLVISSRNEEVMKLALKSGFQMVCRKDPDKKNVRIKTLPNKKLTLRPLYQKIIKIDKKATWFLHASGNMLLNGSSKNPVFIPSSLSLPKLIEIIKNCP